MLDQNVLNSVLSSGGAAPTEAKTKVEKGDAEAFGAAMDEANGSKSAKTKDKKEAKDADDSKAEKNKDRDKKADQHEEQKSAQRAQDTASALHMKKLLSKNVDTLSLAEKQALRIAEFANEGMQPVKALPNSQAQQPQAQAASRQGKSAKGEVELAQNRQSAGSRVASEAAAERVDEKQQKAVEELNKQDQSKTSGSLEQLISKESNFAEELSKTSQADRNRDRQSVIDQILQQIEVRNFNNRTELNLKLNPEYLGELKVKMIHTDDGVRAEFETSSKKTRELLRDAEDDLRTQATAKGVRLGAMRFTLVDKVEDGPQG
jgi:flagellar hook-length control protein FliK